MKRIAPEKRNEEFGLRRENYPVTGCTQAEAIVHIVVRDAELRLVEAAEFAIK